MSVAAQRARSEPWNDPAAKPYLRLREVRKTFGGVTAVDSVNLDVYQGEFFALLGPSGCGKTTLLRMLAGFETPDGGRIEIDGVDMSAVPPYRRPVNMMFQSYALFPHMSVAENVAFGLKQDRVARAEIARRVEEMLSLVQLSGLGARKPAQLSGGQRQRVALARALVKRPKLLLLDEPLAALDKRLREQTQFELSSLQERLGITFVIVTHDQEEAMTVASRMAVMNEGSIVQVGPPAEVYEQPASRFVAEFVGDVNLLEGRIDGLDNGVARLQCGDFGEVAAEARPGLVPGQAVVLAVRPEKLALSQSPPTASGLNCIEGQVFDIGYLGDMSIYHVRCAGARRLTVALANQRRLLERPITWDDRVYVSWPPAAGVVLPA